MASSDASNDVDLDVVPAHVLNVSSRLKLSWYLNPEHSLRSNQGIARDYRGLAEQMGFQYNDIKNFQRNEDPTAKILEAWTVSPDRTIGLLVSYLQNMDRYDVVEDTIDQFKIDAASYMRRTQRFPENPIQVAEVTSCPQSSSFQAESPNALTVTDVEIGGMAYYDAYVCYAEDDTAFVKRLAKYLEERGLVLFIKGRDLLLGTVEPDAHTQLLQERCKFVLIILSPAFLKSPECKWQISFAAGLAVEHRKRKLIPVVATSCEIPSILKYVSKIDFTKPSQDWLLDKLVQSLRATSNSLFISSTASSATPRRQQDLCIQSSANPMITFPPTTTHSHTSSSLASSSLEIASSSNSLQIASSSQVSPVNLTSARTQPQAKQRWYQNIKDKFSLNSSNTQPSTSSTATSGFYSHSGFMSDSSDDKKRDDFSEETV